VELVPGVYEDGEGAAGMSNWYVTYGAEFLVNLDTGEIHHVPFAVSQCQLEEIVNREPCNSLLTARYGSGIPGRDLCAWCFVSKK